METLREHAEEISGKVVGEYWYRGFLQRHPELGAARSQKLDPKRAKNFNKATIDDYFDKMEELEARYGGIPAEHKWNMDEKGIQMGGGRRNNSKKFLYLKSQKQCTRIQSDNLELVTILECVSAAGEVVPPSFVLKHGITPNLIGKIDEDEYAACYFSDSGWTDTLNCEQWISRNFIPFAIKHMVDSEKPIVLFMDGQETHEKPPILRAVYKVLKEQDIEIIIFCFPSKTTHKTQPLDVGIFSHVQKKW
ncbi:hypothetical protein SCHPADRAFT_823234, partial [Schizopora paradoxa]